MSTDLLLDAVLMAETVMVACGVVIAVKVARLTGRPPVGWMLLTGAFSTELVQALFFLLSLFGPSNLQGSSNYVGQLLGLPGIALILAGTYSLYWDFSKQLKNREETILSPEA
jgi:hypothetical protein